MDSMLSAVFTDPNLVYLALIAGLWIGVTAVYMAGTGVVEIIALVLLGASLFALANMPTNWVMLVLLIVSFSGFLLAPFTSTRMGQFAELGLILQAIASLFLFDGLSVSPLLVAIMVIVAFAYHRLLLLPILQAQRQRTTLAEADDVLGARGRVTATIDPVGTIYVKGEHWTARSRDPLSIGTEVVVIGQEGLELRVQKAKRGEELPQANGYHES